MPQTVNMLIKKYIKYISWSPTLPPPPKIQSENKFSAFLQVRKPVWDTLLFYLVWLSQPMLKHICFALVCEKTCTREIKAPEKKQHKRIIKIQWNLLSWNTSDVPLSTNISSHVIHSCFPLSNPSSWLSARRLFQPPSAPLKQAEMQSAQLPAGPHSAVSLSLQPLAPQKGKQSSFILGLDSPRRHTHLEDWLFNASIV